MLKLGVTLIETAYSIEEINGDLIFCVPRHEERFKKVYFSKLHYPLLGCMQRGKGILGSPPPPPPPPCMVGTFVINLLLFVLYKVKNVLCAF